MHLNREYIGPQSAFFVRDLGVQGLGTWTLRVQGLGFRV